MWLHTKHLASNMMQDYGSDVELTTAKLNGKRVFDTKPSVMIACENGRDAQTVVFPKVVFCFTLPVRNFYSTLKPYCRR